MRQASVPLPPLVSITLPAAITSLAALRGSPRVAAGLSDGRVAIWSPSEAAASLVLQPHAAGVIAVGTAADGSELLSVASDGTLARTQISPGATAVTSRVDLGKGRTRAAVFTADGSRLVTGGDTGEVRVFDTVTGAVTARLLGHRTELQAIATRPGADLVASASAESDLRLWDAAAGKELQRIDCGLSLFALEFSPRDGTLASGGVARRLVLHRPKSLEPAGELRLEAPNMIASLAWSPDGRLLAVGHIDSDSLSKGGVRVIDASTRAVVATLDTAGLPPSALAFGGTGTGAVVGVVGRDLRTWAIAR
jgi:WD40 repeat protein